MYPALAIADEIRKRRPDARIVYIGARGKIEAMLVPRHGYPIHLIRARGLPSRKRPGPLIAFAALTGLGIVQSLFLLLRIRPDVVVATGGYASAPLMVALGMLRFLRLSSARSFVHEQNAVPGLVNRVVGRFADRVGVSFEKSLRYFPPGKAVHVGYPVRREIASVDRETARRALNIPLDAEAVFVFGGSQGSRSINRGLVDALPVLMRRERLHVFHVIGQWQDAAYHAARDTTERLARAGLDPEALSRYHQMDYAYHIEMHYAASDLVVGRGGAATITEVCACGCPAIIIPLSNTPGDHQVVNAHILEAEDVGCVLYEEAVPDDQGRIARTVNGRRLAEKIASLLDDPARLAGMADRARLLFDSAGVDRITAQIDALSEYKAIQTGVGSNGDANGRQPIRASAVHVRSHETSTVESLARLSPFQLLERVQRAQSAPEDRRKLDPHYLRYKIDSYLTDARWPVRNVGVKLVGLLGYEDKLPLLLTLLNDRTPASRLQRLFGGDYRQVGFIRRNIVASMIQLGVYTPDIRAALLAALADPYYEVRSSAARAFAALAPPAEPDEEVLRGLIALLKDGSFEVVVAAVRTLGKIGDAAVWPHLRPFYLHTNWKVREAVIYTLIDLVKRNLIKDRETLRQDMDNILATCVYFDPAFPLKQALSELAATLDRRP